MEFLKKKKKILYAGCVFFVIMFLCTPVSYTHLTLPTNSLV